MTGGVVSSLGKGIAAASLAAILEARGLNVTIMPSKGTADAIRTVATGGAELGFIDEVIEPDATRKRIARALAMG